jgi:hypothetical protein
LSSAAVIASKTKNDFFQKKQYNKKVNIYLHSIVELNKRQRRGVLWVTWLFE